MKSLVKPEGILFPKYLTMTPSPDLILFQMPFSLVLSLTAFCSFIDIFLDCVRARWLKKKLSLFLFTNAQ